MRTLRLKPDDSEERYPEDVSKIVSQMNTLGYEISRNVALQAWNKNSEDHHAGWLSVPNSAESTFDEIKDYVEVRE